MCVVVHTGWRQDMAFFIGKGRKCTVVCFYALLSCIFINKFWLFWNSLYFFVGDPLFCVCGLSKWKPWLMQEWLGRPLIFQDEEEKNVAFFKKKFLNSIRKKNYQIMRGNRRRNLGLYLFFGEGEKKRWKKNKQSKAVFRTSRTSRHHGLITCRQKQACQFHDDHSEPD